jgi:hypothetical protein
VTTALTTRVPAREGEFDVPQVMEKNVPAGMIDIIAQAQELLDSSHGEFYIGLADLKNPDGYRHIDYSGVIHSASTIKAFVLEYAYLQIHAGKADLNTVIRGRTLKERMDLMIQISCNSSTADVILHFGRAEINDWLYENYKHTRLYADFAGYSVIGENNSSNVEDSIIFLERVYQNSHEEPYKSILNVMLGTATNAKIPSGVVDFPNVHTANKTGSFFCETRGLAVDHDMGIVIKRDDEGNAETAYAIVFYTFSPSNTRSYSNARPAMVEISRFVYEQMSINIQSGSPR